MQASKVTINPELLHSKVLSRKKKRKLRADSVKSFIKNTPSGQKMDMRPLMAAAGYSPTRQYQTGYTFIANMIKKKEIIKNDPGSKLSTWELPESTKIVKPKADLASEIEKSAKIEHRHVNREPVNSFSEVVKKAKQFAWERNSDSLRDFIATLQ